MPFLYFSPHYDDVALSCGGLVWQQTQSGEPVTILTLCGGEPPSLGVSPFAESLHQRWGSGVEAVRQRKQEDVASCELLGVSYVHLSLPDCIYRLGVNGEPLYDSEESLWQDLHPSENHLVDDLFEQINQLPMLTNRSLHLVSPLTLGGHVDHRLTRKIVEKLALARPLRPWHYADYPYAAQQPDLLPQLLPSGSQVVAFPISEPALEAWIQSIAAHASQLSTFWPDEESLRQSIRSYRDACQGIRLWRI